MRGDGPKPTRIPVAEFKIPELGENITGGDVTRVLVGIGDTVVHDQPVIELETDKATIEVPSSVAGVVRDIKVKVGDKVQIGAVILTVEDAAAEAPEDPGVPAAGGVQTSGAGREPRALDQKVVAMPRPASEPPREAGAGPGEPAKNEQAGYGHAAPASPSVRRLAREVGVDIDEVLGHGPADRISQEDVKEHARRAVSHVGAGGGRRAAPALPDFTKWGEVERQPMSNIRRKTAEHLAQAWNAIPHVTQFDKADITAMEELRRKYREQVQTVGGNLTVTAMLVKVLATAVKHFPQFNASLDTQAEEIVYKKYVNIGIAVDTDRGLLVPVIRGADEKNLTEIAIEVHRAAEKARARKLSPDDMRGGGMTISNLGGIGGTYFSPIINWPEVAILGVSRGAIEPVWVPGSGSGGLAGSPSNGPRGTFEPRPMLPLSLSYDHRVIDGADAARFLRWVVEAIEQPFLLSLLG